MSNTILKRLTQENLLSEDAADKIQQFETGKPFSLHWELTLLLYTGVLMLNIGLGVLIYENIDTIGHAVIIFGIGALSMVCFAYALRRKAPFSKQQVLSPNPYFDYILLLGCLLFLIMEGYWQFQYHIFGEKYGLATFIPMVLFSGVAYFFDHKGVLSLALTLMATWVGIAVTPLDLLRANDFDSPRIIYTGAALGVFWMAIPYLMRHFALKVHFSEVYFQFSIHIFMISCLAGLMSLDQIWLFAPLLAFGLVFFGRYAQRTGSLFFLTAAIIYCYIGFTYLLFTKVFQDMFDSPYLYMWYFFLSCAGIIYFFLHYKKILKTK